MRRRQVVLFIAWTVITAVAIAQDEDFSEARLRAGREAYRQKLPLEAIDEFRIAAFGFLDRPPLLSETLARLAVAQSAAGRSADLAATLSRFLGVERQFAPYAEVNLEPDVRTEFQALLLRQVPQTTLLSMPGLAGLVETEEQKIAKLPHEERRKALEARLRREPGNATWPLGLAREAAERGAHKDVERWTEKALELNARNTEALALRVHARTARGECSGALSDLKALPQAELVGRPEVLADRFVCLVAMRDWTGAEESLRLIPPQLMLRSDVAKAERELTAVSARRNKKNGPSLDGASRSAEATRTGSPEKTVAAPSPDGSVDSTRDQVPEKRPEGDSTRQLSVRAREVLAESRRLVAAGKSGSAEKILVETLKSEGEIRELRLALLEASCLSRAWKKGAQQLPLIGPFEDSEAVPMFYAAVVLYETGRADEARSYMARARPKVTGPLVDEYAKKILGSL